MTEKERLELLGLGSFIKNDLAEYYQKQLEEQRQLAIDKYAEPLKLLREEQRKAVENYAKQYELYAHNSISKQLEEAVSNMQKFTIPKDTISQYLESALAMDRLLPKSIFTGDTTKETQKTTDKEKQMPETKAIKINSIKLNNFRFFTDDERNNTFEIDGENVLIYGENGSGKSSLFKAFEFLVSSNIVKSEFEENRNIFNDTSDTSLEFIFDNDAVFEITKDSIDISNYSKELQENYPFIKALSVFRPILDYKHLLKIHYQTDKKKDEINIYEMLKELFKDFPLDDGKALGSIANPNDYFKALDEIINGQFLANMNSYLSIFDDKFKIDKFTFDMNFAEDGRVEPVVNIKIALNDFPIPKYHLFLNEARLTALAISIYFTIIKEVSKLLSDGSLKILVLDDLLISLDMSNRTHLLELVRKHFDTFQIFFFTHDKGLFDVFKNKMKWKSFEIYVDGSGEYDKPKLLPSLDYFQKAQKYFDEHDYPACANYLRKEVERLKKLAIQGEKTEIPRDRSFEILDGLFQSDDFEKFVKPEASDASVVGSIRGKLIGAKKSFENNRIPSIEIDLKEVKAISERILHPYSHDDTSKPLYKKELEEAMGIIGKFRKIY
jgi:energy-coupling factor transporter ATP-binding protein EcfA2